MHQKINTIIFDMDGLMFDTEHLSREIWIQLFNQIHFPIKEEFFQKITGSNIHDSISYFEECYPNSKYSFLELKDIKNKQMIEYIIKNGVPIKDGLFELLTYLKENNYKILLATSTSKKQAMTILEKAGVVNYFDNMMFGDEIINSKPNPEIFIKVAKKENKVPSECLVLEDSKNGINAGVNGGFNCVYIPDTIIFTPPSNVVIKSSLKEVINYLISNNLIK